MRSLDLSHPNPAVEAAEVGGDPCASRLGEHELQLREALEHRTEHEVPQTALEEQVRLARPHGDGRRPRLRRLGRSDRDRMAVHRHADLAARRPERIEGAFVQVDEVAHVIRRDQHAGQSRRLGPTHLGDGVVEVAQEHLRHPGTPPRQLGAEVDQPTVVRLHTRPPVAVLLLGRWRRSRDGARRIEGRHRVREEHLGDDALALEMLHTLVAVPVVGRASRRDADPDELVVGVGQLAVVLGPRLGEFCGPVVELVVELAREVRLVVQQVGAGMTVGRDHGVSTRF